MLKVYLSSVWISIKESVMVSGIVYVFMGSEVIGHVQLSLLIMGAPAGALTTIGCSIFFLILLQIDGTVSTCVRMTPVKSFLNQTTYSEVRIKIQMLYICIIR